MNQSVSFGNRLREQRVKLGLSQSAFGQLAGVTKKTQMLYEADERAPDTNYMAAIAAAGVDAYYILTGVDEATRQARADHSRGTALARAKLREEIALAALPPRQRALLDNYENSDESGKKIIEGTASLAAQPRAAKGGK